MIFKLLIVAILVLIVLSLGSSLVFLISDKGQKTRTAKALTLRIALSVGLFVLLIVAYATGLIAPHGVYPAAP